MTKLLIDPPYRPYTAVWTWDGRQTLLAASGETHGRHRAVAVDQTAAGQLGKRSVFLPQDAITEPDGSGRTVNPEECLVEVLHEH